MDTLSTNTAANRNSIDNENEPRTGGIKEFIHQTTMIGKTYLLET